MNEIEIIKFRKYFFKNFNKLDKDVQDIFFKKLEVIEEKDYITKRLQFKEYKYEVRCLRIGKQRFIYIFKDNIATFLDVMYRELGYPSNYINKLIKVYEHGE